MKLGCAIYTRKSSEEGLEQDFNSLDAQREACEAFVLSQKAQGWLALPQRYDDGGFSGGNMNRPALQRLLEDVAARKVQVIVVYKVDRLTRSLADFAKLVELFDANGVSFVSVTQQFNTTSSMGRLTLNVLLSFAQFEREVTGERIRDKIAASKRRGMWMGGRTPVGYKAEGRTLVADPDQAERIRTIYKLYLELSCVRRLKAQLDALQWLTPPRVTRNASAAGERPYSRGHLYRILSNPLYAGRIAHKGKMYEGQHPPLIEPAEWQAVQERLASNRQGHRSGAQATEPSPLAGLVFDEADCRLTPSHAQKGSRRYRYYVSQATPERPALRLPAQDLEEATVEAVRRHFEDEAGVVAAMASADADSVTRALQIAKSMLSRIGGGQASKVSVLREVVDRVTVMPDELRVRLKHSGIGRDGTASVAIPMQRKRCGMAVRLIVATDPGRKRSADPRLVNLLLKARRWMALLTSGQADSIETIAKAEQVSGSYVTRVAYLGFMAPHLVQRIVAGEHAASLTADRLIRLSPLPMDWARQRELLEL